MMHPGARAFAFVVFALSFALSVAGQATTGAITGTVTHDGQPLPGVTITVASSAMQGTRTAYSYVNGDYNVATIPPGDYRVVFEMEGMTTATKKVDVGLARIERVDIAMVPLPVTVTVTVTAASPTVAETTEVHSNFQAELVEDLPIERTVQAAVALAPGVKAGPNEKWSMQISGAVPNDSLYLLNGAVAGDPAISLMQNFYVEDAIQETSVLTGSISAEYGRFTGGVVSTITKSGGNEFAGSLRDSLTNPSWFEPTDYGEEKAESSLDEVYEATLGGRLIRDRLWFFTAGRYAELTFPEYYANSDSPKPAREQIDDRFELKLTGQPHPRNNLVASYVDYTVDNRNTCNYGPCWEASTMDDGYVIPRTMWMAQYSGIASNNLLVEANFSTSNSEITGVGNGYVTTDFDDPRDLALGTWGFDYTCCGGTWGAPVFGGDLSDLREQDYYRLKATWFLATAATGTHSIVGGYERFTSGREANYYQSGSDFGMYIYNEPPVRDADGTVYPVITGASDSASGFGDVIFWGPVPERSQGSDYVTDSLFLNDKWDLGSRWSFNIGARIDRNEGHDSSGHLVADDQYVSPRLGVVHDVKGDGRFRLGASYSKYVSGIREANSGPGGSGGNPSYFLYQYDGPPIQGLRSFDALTEMFRWFLAQGGTDATDLLFYVRIPGYTRVIDGTLDTPNTEEWTISFGSQIGTKGFVRIDYVDREWDDFLVEYNVPGDHFEDPYGTTGDISHYDNLDAYVRTYEALQLQASYRASSRLGFGGNYTWSELRGNQFGQFLSPFIYQEYKAFPQHNPIGYLAYDQTHKARFWVTYDQPLGSFGALNVSILERYESGLPYSAEGFVPTRSFVTNPGYLYPPRTVHYYFSERGAYRFDDMTATDLALNWELPVRKVSLFVQGEILNLFNEQAQVTGTVPSVRVLRPFNPFTDTPVEGVDWAKPAGWAEPISPTDYQTPRTYRASVGVRF